MVAVVTLVVLVNANEAGAREPDGFAVLLLLAAASTQIVRARWPVGVLVAVTLVAFVYLGLDYPGGAELPLVMVALYTAMAAGRRVPALTVLAVFVSSGIAYRLVVDGDDPLLVAVTVALPVLVVMLGDSVHTRRRLRAEVAERLRAMELERDLEARGQLMAERLRIARELHDVLAHTITAITVQAGAAADGLDEDAEARAVLRSMRATALEAMRQLGATIELLRSDDDHPDLHAAPGLTDLPGLAASVVDAGVPVELTIDATPDEVSATVQLTVYRIVQEALTNVIRHTQHATAEVVVQQGRGRLIVTIEDDGGDAANDALREPGFGIVGMQERAHAAGGRLTVGHGDRGGYRVLAELPLVEGRP